MSAGLRFGAFVGSQIQGFEVVQICVDNYPMFPMSEVFKMEAHANTLIFSQALSPIQLSTLSWHRMSDGFNSCRGEHRSGPARELEYRSWPWTTPRSQYQRIAAWVARNRFLSCSSKLTLRSAATTQPFT